MWIIFCLIATIAAGLTAIPCKLCIAKNTNITRVNILAMLLYHCLFLITILISKSEIFLNFSFDYFIDIAPLAFFQAIGAVCYYMSLKYTLVSTTTIITRCKVLGPLILGVVVLHEYLSIAQVVLSVLLFVFTLLVSTEKTDNKIENKKSNFRGILYAYAFVIISGGVSFFNKVYINTYHDPLIVLFYVGIITIFLILLYILVTRKFETLNFKKVNGKVFFLAFVFCDFISSLFNRISLVDGPVSIISVIESSSIIVGVLAAYFILKEKISFRKAILITLIIVCVLGLAILSVK